MKSQIPEEAAHIIIRDWYDHCGLSVHLDAIVEDQLHGIERSGEVFICGAMDTLTISFDKEKSCFMLENDV